MTTSTTSNQYFFGQAILVSETDLHGTIVYANDAFVTVSGYRRNELMGQPHNIIRHPDMPGAAFADMWRSLKLGLPWSGLVKNRRKNGDYYWVMARATPVYENGEVVRYLSVRYAPEQQAVAAAEQAYQKIKQGKLSLQGGRAKRFWHKCPLFQAQPMHLIIGFALLMALAVLGDALSMFTLEVPFLLMLFAVFGGLMVWKLQQNANKMASYSQALSQFIEGQFNQDVIFEHHASLSKTNIYDRLGAQIGIAQSNLARIQDESQTLVDEGLRNTTAIDFASVGLMIVDNDYVIQYANPSILATLIRHEKVLQRHLAGFDVNQIVGSSMDLFYQDPQHQRQLMANLTQPLVTRIELEQMTLELELIPIIDAGHRYGTVVEWRDISDIQRVEEEIKSIVVCVEQGLFDRRIENFLVEDPVLSSVAQELNKMMEVLDQFMNDAGTAIGQLAFSRINQNMKGSYRGALRSLQNSANLSFRSLNEVVGQVQFNASQVKHATFELSDGVNHFSDNVQQQAAAIQQTSASMQEMAGYVQETAANVNRANQVGEAVMIKVNHGSEVMQQAVNAMKTIEESGQQINEITRVIDGLAFQTNLLALNAAVEAARAGDHGRGFAVVASEVRSLAQKSAEAAKDIQELISNSVEQITKGTRLVTQTEEELQQIKQSVVAMTNLVSEVTHASKEQESGIQEVNNTIKTMDEVAQQSAAVVEQTAANSSHVAEQVSELENLVSVFELGEMGQKVKRVGRTPLADYKQAHFNWRIRMANVVSGQEIIEDVSSVQNHHLCGLGKWRDSEGRRFDHLPEMQQLDVVHEAFHQKIAQAIELKNAGDQGRAYQLLQDVEQMSAQVVDLLEKIELSMADENTHSVPSLPLDSVEQ